MHQIHTTPGFIIDERPYGEAGKIFSIFTREFGLVQATAQGIRLERSKLRYHAQLYSFGDFSLVRGKDLWRLTSAAPASQSGKVSPRNGDSDGLIARLALLLRRLLQGEEAHPEAFDAVRSCAQFLDAQSDPDRERAAVLESLTVARILHWLGYIGDAGDLDAHLKSSEVSGGLLDALKGKRAAFNRHINKALKESQL